MGRLAYTAITSLDGYVADAEGSFSWAAPDEELHSFANELASTVGTYLLGRRMHEVMAYWDSAPVAGASPAVLREFALGWQAADKVVYSTTLDRVDAPRTRLEKAFDPERVRQLVVEADRDVAISGPTLAACALHAGLVDELHWIALPIVVGGGTAWLPSGLRLDLELTATRSFTSGATYVRYALRR